VLRCILKNGSAGLSVRRIAAEAGVSLGLIRYHFGEFDELIAYAFDMTTDAFFQSIDAALERPGQTLRPASMPSSRFPFPR